MTNIQKSINWGTAKLKRLDNPKLEAEVLLADVLGCDRIYLRTHNLQELSFKQNWRFKSFINKRAKHIPVAQIIGYQEWAGIKILVNEHVLIPRDETEILVNEIVKNQNPLPQTILDVGTGSGCISIFLKKHFSGSETTALDISKKALKQAKKNAKLHNVEINFQHSNLLEKISNNTTFDLIVANLPYVPENLEVSTDLSYEPQNAIFSGDDGLDLIRRLKTELVEKEIKFKELWLEFLPKQKYAIKKIFDGFEIEFVGDLGGDVFFAKVEYA